MQITPPFSVADAISGELPIDLYLHLGEGVAVQPYTAGTMVDATFAGYLPALLIVSKRQEYQGGYGFLEATGNFLNNDPSATFQIRSAWITARYPPTANADQLLSVIPTISVTVPPGAWAFTVRVGSFQQIQLGG